MLDPHRQQRLQQFVAWVRQHITGDEKGEAQIFLDRLFQAFGQPGCKDVGGTLEMRVQRNNRKGTAFADYVWKPVVLIEMKKRGELLSRHLRQAFDYWVELAPNRPQFVILCNFDQFQIFDFDQDIHLPQETVTLDELPDFYHGLAFLFPTREAPRFRDDRGKATRDAAELLANCYNKLKVRTDIHPAVPQRFVLQMLVALFSEDIGLLPRYFVTQLLDECTDPPKTFDLLNSLFTAMNTRGGVKGGRFKGVDYFNGGLFAQSAAVELADDELVQLKQAATYDWSKISPEIFGNIFQHSMDERERHKLGGHYTSPADIMKIVGPTLSKPWRSALDDANSVARLRHLHQRLQALRVLDPACGSGNFLYLAYRELKRIESEIVAKLRDIAPAQFQSKQQSFGFVTAKQFFGMDIVPFAVELAKVTLMLAPKLAIDELHTDENALPLDNLDTNVRVCDALIDDLGNPTAWPDCDIIIGNPPFLGAKRLKPERGADYINKVRKAFPTVPGMADYCVYWIRRSHDHLPACTVTDPFRGRAGLVGTQNIRNNQSRVGGLDHVVNTGGVIVEAVDNQPWSGEANVHVSIVNWVKCESEPRRVAASPTPEDEDRGDTPRLASQLLIPATKKLWQKVDPSSPLFDPAPDLVGRKSTQVTGKRGKVLASKSFELACRDVDHINSALSDEVDVSDARVLQCNTTPQRIFNGQFPRHQGFVLTPDDAREMIHADDRNKTVIHPFLIGREMITHGQALRWVIDFQKADLFEAQTYTSPFARIKGTVLPHIQSYANAELKKTGKEIGQDQTWLRSWWQHFRCRKEMVDTIAKLPRYLACAEVTKRPIFCFVDSDIRPDHTLEAFTFADDYSFGILQSDVHWQWFITKCSKLTERFRYTPESVFDTFPWPQGKNFRGPGAKDVDAVAEAGREVRRIRAEALTKMRGGLRAVYRTLELPGRSPLKDAHAALDAAVLKAYGFSAQKDLLAQLLELNLAVAQRIENQQPVTGPGVPTDYGDAQALVSEDCIAP